MVFALGIVAAAWLWTRSVTPATLVAEAEVVQAQVRSPQAGVIASLNVTLFQTVNAGDVIGKVATANPRILDATLAVIRAEVGMLAATMQGTTDRQRVTIEFERLNLESMSQRIDLASAQVRLQQAEADFARAGQLHRSGLITNENFEQAKANRDALAAQVVERSKMVEHLAPIIKNFATPEALAAGFASDTAVSAAIKVEEAKLRLAEEQLTPQPLISPITGTVTVILRRAGENVSADEPVVLINATKSERLIGYLRQPLPFEPKPGMTAEIRTRAATRQFATTKVVHVGAVMESITPSLLAAMRLPPVPAPEPGVRVHLAIPEGLTLRPGEHVDVIIH